MSDASERWCKICGVTSVADARAVASAGADAYGLNFYSGSARVVTAAIAAEIATEVPVPTRIGVFYNPTEDEVADAMSRVDLDMLQFHGEEAPEFCAAFGMPFLKAIRMAPGVSADDAQETYANAWGLLLDTYVKGAPGGTGATFDWSRWPERRDVRLVLAGGLTPENVAEAVSATDPFGVDVAGGVEEKRRVKDPRLVNQFVMEARSV